ncbi:MAG: PD40 domain-containing protein [Planctomycetes bacterium]|nr:PD40 domain-containing protein [Planctomycetota bacterium]
MSAERRVGVISFKLGIGAVLAIAALGGGCAPRQNANSVEVTEKAPPAEAKGDFTGKSWEASPSSAGTGMQRNTLPANASQHTFTSIGRAFDPDISSDGQILAFASTAHCDHPDVYIKAVDGFAVTQITSDPADDIQPRFSPDGRQIVFCSNRTGNWDVWLVDRDGGNLTQITHDAADEIAPTWSPDGKRIAFSAWGSRSNQWEIWTVAVDRPGTRRHVCPGLFAAWSPDGSRIAFQRARQRGTRWFSIWAVDLIDDEAMHPTELASDDGAACVAPRWSADGRSLAYSQVPLADARESTATLWTVDCMAGLRRQLTDDGLTAFNPAWGNGRVYFVASQGGVENIWSVPGGAASSADENAVTANTPTQAAGRTAVLGERVEKAKQPEKEPE